MPNAEPTAVTDYPVANQSNQRTAIMTSHDCAGASTLAGLEEVVEEEERMILEEQQARQLRADLDSQLERVRSLSVEEQFELTEDEQLAQLIMISSQYEPQVLQRAVLLTKDTGLSDETTSTNTKRLPLHLACDTNAPLAVIRWLLDADPSGGSISVQAKDRWGDLPLHTACSRQDVEVVRILLERDTTGTTILTKDHHGALPLHMACRYNVPTEAIQLLLDSDLSHTSLVTGGPYDQLPLHVACRCNLAVKSIQLLLDNDHDKGTVLVEDNAGRLALHVAYLRNNPPSVINILMQAMLYGRAHRVGWELWKRDMRQFLKSLSVHERDFNASDKNEMTREVLRDFMERAFALELAIWKTSMERRGCFLNENNRDTKDNSFSEEERHESRVMSGADIILPTVLSFLEDEPIVALFEKFQS